MRGVLRGIFRSERKNTSSEETVDKHHSLDQRGPSRLEWYNQSVTELQLHCKTSGWHWSQQMRSVATA